MVHQIRMKHEEGIFFEEGAELEVVNILSGMSQLGYRNAEIIEILNGYLVGEKFEQIGEVHEQYDLFTLYNILTSFARLAP